MILTTIGKILHFGEAASVNSPSHRDTVKVGFRIRATQKL